MCGIVGTLNFCNKQYLSKMLARIAHRGPDEEGMFFDENMQFMLGSRRLSILDIKHGKQPMISENKKVILVFNGEIFNFLEIKNDLQKKGCHFKTNNSDTEVILQSYLFYGIDFINKLNGMFAIAIYDLRNETCYLARDRFGIKPLFYSLLNNKLSFASEIKSLLELPYIKKNPNLESVYSYFSLKNIPAPNTAFKNIFQIKPGEILIKNKFNIKKKIFWTLPKKNLNFEKSQIKKNIYNYLEQSVKMQMRSDVEVGSFLSGGLDSSVVSFMASKFSSKKLKTFTLVYDSKIKNKMPDKIYAKKLSKMISSDHHELKINNKSILKDIEPALDSFDQPFAGVISTYFLAKEISKYVKVALSGDGADELFGSYYYPRVMQMLELGKKNTKNFSKIINQSLEFKNKIELIKELKKENIFFIKDKLLNISNENRKIFFKKGFYSKFEKKHLDYFVKISKNISKKDLLNFSLNVDFKSLLPDQVLSFVDILSMAHSLEVRPPFLDNNLVDFVFKIRGNYKIKNSINKYILKETMEKILPKNFIYRKKEGFVMPVEEIFLKKQVPFVKNILSKKNLNKHGLFNNEVVLDMIKNLNKNSFYDNNKIWILLCFQIWWEKNF